MSGALKQLIIGQEDIYLTSNPQITFFKNSYKRYTNFAIETLENQINGDINFESTMVCNINKTGDLLSKLFLKIEVSGQTSGENKTTGKWAWIENLGHNIIDNIILEIGGHEIDRQYGNWLNIWYELNRNENQDEGYNKLIGNIEAATKLTNGTGLENDKFTKMFIPLNFFFCRNYSVALPLIALKFNDIKLLITLKDKNKLYKKTNHSNFSVTPKINNISVLTDYIFLDTQERRYFISNPHEYIIEQTNQYINSIKSDNNYKLPFKYVTKALFWNLISGKYITQKIFLSDNIEIITKKFILSFFYLDTYDLGTTFIKINTSTPEIFNISDHINIDYHNIVNINNKNIKEIVNLAYINKSNVSSSTITLDDITVPELLPIEIASFVSSKFNDGSSDALFNQSITRIEYQSAENSSEYDIVLNNFSNFGTYIDNSINPIDDVVLKLNGQDRFSKQNANYFNLIQPFQHFKSSPKIGIFAYSFALNPSEYQPSGTCNLSKFNEIELNLTINENFDSNNSDVYIYSMNYNLLKIQSGIANLTYI